MAEKLSLEDAVARFEPVDTLGIPLATGQPPGLLAALGERTDWEDLSVYGALLAVGTELFGHPNVHYLSGFFSPLERALRDDGAGISFVPADFRRFAPLLESQKPRVVTTVATPPDDDGWCSLSLHAGSTPAEFRRASEDPERLLVVEVSENFPRTFGLDDYRHALHLDEIDVLVETDSSPLPLPDVEPTDADSAIARHATELIPDGATLQTGIGSIPSAIAGQLAHGERGDFGIHSEMFTTGLMQLHESGKVSNAGKGTHDGVSVSTFAAGSAELYSWLDGNEDVAFLPVERINSSEAIASNRRMVTINGAMAIDIHGQVVADTIEGNQFSGIGGHEDFVSGPGIDLEDRSLICLPSTAKVGDEVISRIVPWFGPGAVITTPRHQVDVIVTEHGAAELQGKTVHQRGEALAAIAAPEFRDGLLEAAARASHGHSPFAEK